MRSERRVRRLEAAKAPATDERPARHREDVDDPALDTRPSREQLLQLKREIRRLERESRQALAVLEEVCGDGKPDMLVVPRLLG